MFWKLTDTILRKLLTPATRLKQFSISRFALLPILFREKGWILWKKIINGMVSLLMKNRPSKLYMNFALYRAKSGVNMNKNMYLNPKLFDKDIEQVPSRNGYGE